MMTAYDVLRVERFIKELSLKDYDQLVEDFQASFWKARNFSENISIHRRPQEYKQGILQELYDLIGRIQRRSELQDFDPIKIRQGYAHIRIQEIWVADKRLRTIYNATKKYCNLTGKQFSITLVHIAEYRALNLLVKKLHRSIRRSSNSIIEKLTIKKRQVTKKRKSISAKLRRELQKEANSKCPFCNNDEVAIHEIHHINEDPSDNDFENLIHLCGNCHSKITVGTISREEVLATKLRLKQGHSIRGGKTKMYVQSNATNITTGDYTSVTIKQEAKKIIQKFPPGCIGFEIIKANYIQYLITRYHEYKLWEVGKEKMNYAIIYKQLKHQFKLGNRNILNLPVERFEELTQLIQNKISGSKLAKIKGSNHKNYSSFEEYQLQNDIGPLK